MWRNFAIGSLSFFVVIAAINHYYLSYDWHRAIDDGFYRSGAVIVVSTVLWLIFGRLIERMLFKG